MDEVIDVKFIPGHDSFALLCSNSETMKLLNLKTGSIELYMGHTDIIICLDIVKKRTSDQVLVLSGAKDNTIKVWQLDLTQNFQKRLVCLSTFFGHTENIASVAFAPKH